MTIELEVSQPVYIAPIDRAGDEGDMAPSYVQSVDSSGLRVAAPIHRGARHIYPVGRPIVLYARGDHALHRVQALIVEFNPRRRIPSMRLHLDGHWIRVQRRRFVRWECSLTVRWWQKEGEDAGSGRTLDLSAGGMTFRASGSLTLDAIYQFLVALPSGPLHSSGRVLRRLDWTSGSSPGYAVGFVGLPSEEEDRIMKYIFDEQMLMRAKGLI